MKNSLNKAMEIAKDAHKFQVDKSKEPYINHPIAVSKMVSGKKEKIVALLHDVLEDSTYTKSDLEKYFTKDVCDAVEVLTRDKSVNYFKYIMLVKKNPLAAKVKLADLRHNMDVSRLKEFGDAEAALVKKYLCAYHILQGK